MAELPRGYTRLEVDDSNYSTFVPMIGMYIAFMSLLCFFALSHDVFSLFRHKKKWLPCQLFSLNSLTLTLLGVAATLPVDLTTSMPTPLDQFSKLTGTSLICISMGFFMPSLGTTPKPETLSNMLALSLFVLTVVVNICMQIQTGVIFLLIPEHIMVMCFMLAMLMVLWFCSEMVASAKDVFHNQYKVQFKDNYWPLLPRLELAYLYGFNYNPQLLLCKDNQIYVVAGLCIACSGVVAHASANNLNMVFCRGSSAYGWSVWGIVLIQILIVIIGTSAAVVRCWGLATSLPMTARSLTKKSEHAPPTAVKKFLKADARFEIAKEIKSSCLRMNSRDWWSILFKLLSFCIPGLLFVLVCVPLRTVFVYIAKVFCFILEGKPERDVDLEKYGYLAKTLAGGELRNWGLIESVKDMKAWKNTTESKSLENLAVLLKRVSPTRKYQKKELKNEYWKIGNIEVSSLSVVVLVMIACSLPPSVLGHDSLLKAYGEVYEIVHFVEDRVKLMDTKNRKKSKFAEAIRMGRDFRILVTQGSTHLQLGSLEHLEKKFPVGLPRSEAKKIKKYLNAHKDSNESDLYEDIQKLFVAMLLKFLTILPQTLYKEVADSTAENFFERVKTSLGILLKIKPLEAQIHWSFPKEFNEMIGTDTQSQIGPIEEEDLSPNWIRRAANWILRRCRAAAKKMSRKQEPSRIPAAKKMSRKQEPSRIPAAKKMSRKQEPSRIPVGCGMDEAASSIPKLHEISIPVGCGMDEAASSIPELHEICDEEEVCGMDSEICFEEEVYGSQEEEEEVEEVYKIREEKEEQEQEQEQEEEEDDDDDEEEEEFPTVRIPFYYQDDGIV